MESYKPVATPGITPILLLFLILPGIFFNLNNKASAQSQFPDSLTRVIAGQTDSPNKVDNMVQLARFYYLHGQYDSTLSESEKALDMATKLNYPAGKGDAYYLQSSAYRMKTDYKTSLSLTDKYLEIYLILQDSLRLAKGYFNLGMLHKESGDYEIALHYCQMSLSYALKLKESSIMLGNYNCIGSIYLSGTFVYDSAAAYYLKALDIVEKKGNTAHLSVILNNLGDVYLADKQYELARNFIYKSLELNLVNGKKDMLALNYLNLGRTAIGEKKDKEALDFYNKALTIFIELDDQRGIADVNNNFGDTYFWLGKYDLALHYFDLALTYYKEKEYTRGIVMSTLNKAAVFSELGKTAQAEILYDSCITLAESEGNMELLIQAYRNISDNQFKSGDFKSAYKNRLTYEALYDSVFNIEKSKAINTLLLKYEKGKADARILELEKENLQKTNQRNAYMFTGLGILVIALFLVIYFRQKSRHDRIVAEQKILQLEEEKKLMAAKLLVEGQEEERKRIATELHDGLGVLLSATKMQFSVISEKSPENKELIDRATKMLEQASGDVRKISHNMMPGLLTKLGFYEAAEDLFERIGDGGELNATCTITGDQERLPENKEIMLYRIVQEMVNNSLKHAKAKNIALKIQVMPGTMEIIYTDDGVGFDYNKKLENESMGLKSIQSRVNFLNGTLSVESRPGQGVKYLIQIVV